MYWYLRDRMAVAVLFCALPGFASAQATQSTEPVSLSADPSSHQDSPPASEPQLIVLSQQQLLDVERWAREFDEWQQWAARWLNRRQPGLWAIALERNKKPDPPVWLEGACELLDSDDQLARPCRFLTDWREDSVATWRRQEAAMALAQKETPTKSAWWRHSHLDTMWSTTQSNAAVFGLVGAHLTMEVKGRLQVFIAPGIMLVSVPQFAGTRELIPATDWGVTYRLFNVGQSTVHFNLVHAWLLGNPSNLLNSQISLAGFSFSFRTHPASP